MEQRRGEGKQRFLKEGGVQAGSRGGCLKKGGLEPPYELWFVRKGRFFVTKQRLLMDNKSLTIKLPSIQFFGKHLHV